MSASAGRVLLLFKGDYDANVTYSPMDVVIYGVSSYVCKVESTGNLPTNSTYWQIFAKGLSNMSPEEIGIGYAIASGSGSARTATLSGYNLTPNGIVSVTFAEAVPANATLNINSEGAKAIYYRGAAIVANVIRAGDTATFAYDGTRYQVLCIDGGAGHEIENSAGTKLTQRDVLKFMDGLKATDDSTDEETVISAKADHIEAADWYAMTDQEQDAYADEHFKFTIDNIDEADEFVNVDLMTKLWENPSPTSAFASQNITLSSSDYDILLVITRAHTSNDICQSAITYKGGNADVFSSFYSSNQILVRQRALTYVSDTSYTVENCTQNGTAVNECLIPLVIYGIKKRATVKVDAIAANVKASVDYSTDEHAIGTWIDGSTLYEKTVDIGNLPSATTKTVAHGIANFGTLIKLEGVGIKGTSRLPLPYVTGSINDCIAMQIEGNNINIACSNTWPGTYVGYVTIRYTKTS